MAKSFTYAGNTGVKTENMTFDFLVKNEPNFNWYHVPGDRKYQVEMDIDFLILDSKGQPLQKFSVKEAKQAKKYGTFFFEYGEQMSPEQREKFPHLPITIDGSMKKFHNANGDFLINVYKNEIVIYRFPELYEHVFNTHSYRWTTTGADMREKVRDCERCYDTALGILVPIKDVEKFVHKRYKINWSHLKKVDY